jgi:hypothetical protein
MRFPAASLLLGLALASAGAQAVTTAGRSSVVVIPVVAKTATFTSEVFVHNPLYASLTLNVLYYEANDLAAPGLKSCNQLTVPIGQTRSFTIADQCPDPALATGSHFGMLVLEDASDDKVNVFSAYVRTESNSARQGFSIEGFPAGGFAAPLHHTSVGLKRVTVAQQTPESPSYQTNCFVGSLGEAVDYNIAVVNSSGATLGSVAGSLGPWQLKRYLDIFTEVGAPAGDYTNATAFFSATNTPAKPALVGFCTVQNNVYFGADFRIAKSTSAENNGANRKQCSATNAACSSYDGTLAIPDETKKDVLTFMVHHPDYLKCQLIGDRVNDLEMRVFRAGEAVAHAGGSGEPSFSAFTGHRSEVNNGQQSLWTLEVSFRETGNSITPIPYGVRCDSGNGTSPMQRISTDDLADDF